MLKINSILIENIGPIQKLALEFNSRFNIICGQNGIGKTTVLDCLAQSFVHNHYGVRKSANADLGSWSVQILGRDQVQTKVFNTDKVAPEDSYFSMSGFGDYSTDVIVFKTHRDIAYRRLQNLEIDATKTHNNFANEILSGSVPNSIKNWFVNRHLWDAHPGELNPAQKSNIQTARECFGLLNSDFAFSKVNPPTNDILIKTPKGDVNFEVLSSGYKSCLAVLLGLIQEIELRHKEPYIRIQEFDGIVFIDEIDLHLHPEYQAKIYTILRNLLPRAQIFTSTHSPHILQVADPAEIIPLILDDQGNILVNKMFNTHYGCQGWTLEEILTDVMGMKETRSPAYKEAISSFNAQLTNDDKEGAGKSYQLLGQMLHPESTLLKILKLQMAGIGK